MEVQGCHERRVWCFKRSGVKIVRAVVIEELFFLLGGEGDHGFPLMNENGRLLGFFGCCLNRLSGMMKLEGLPKPVEASIVRRRRFAEIHLDFLRVHGGPKNPVISRVIVK